MMQGPVQPMLPAKADGFFQSALRWISDIWDKLDVDAWFGDQYTDALRVSVYFVSFFAVGFLFKKYLKYVIISVALSIVLIKGMEHYKILDIDWEALNIFLGFAPTATLGSIAQLCIDWVKDNLIVAASGLLGFLLGYKLR